MVMFSLGVGGGGGGERAENKDWLEPINYTVLLDFIIQTCNCAQLVEEIFLQNSEFSKQGEETVNELLF